MNLLSGAMMLELGGLLLIVPERLNNLAVVFGLLGVALLATWIAARLTREKSRPDG